MKTSNLGGTKLSLFPVLHERVLVVSSKAGSAHTISSMFTVKVAVASAPSSTIAISVPPAAVPLSGVILFILGVIGFLNTTFVVISTSPILP